MNLAVVGSGYVGLVAGACFAEIGHQVMLVDNDPDKVRALQQGEVPIHERFLPELVERHRGRRLKFTEDLGAAVRASQVVFIAVGTPAGKDGRSDLSYVEAVARGIAEVIDEYKLIVAKSTVPVHTSQWIRRVVARNGAPVECFDVASNPEFLREGSAVTDFLYPDRIVAGTDSPRAAELLRQCYEPLLSGNYYGCTGAIPAPDGAQQPQLIRASASSAELIKHLANAFLAMKISFVNAVASICEAVGADVDQVVEGLGSDSRIGPRFLSPGIGYGGSCFPKDLTAFAAVARDNGYDFRLLDEVVRINEQQRLGFVLKVRRALWTLKGKRLAVLGLAFKGGTDDVRESPAIAIVEALAREGCRIAAYDPAAMERAAEVLPAGQVVMTASPYEAARGADALLILTDWEEFSVLELDRIAGALRYPIVIDGRNLYGREQMARHGLTYLSVGRPDVTPQPRLATADRKAA